MGRLLGWFIGLSVLFLILWICWTSPTLYECASKEYENYSGNAFQDNISRLYVLLVGTRLCLGEFVHNNGEAVIALFTIILALATILLWIATQNLLRGAEDTSQKQLRAYIGYEGGEFENIDLGSQKSGRNVECRIVLTNFGKTPAKAVTISWKTWLKAEKDFLLTSPCEEQSRDGTLSFFAPTAEIKLGLRFSRCLTDEEFSNYQIGYIIFRAAIKVTYDDVFGAHHHYHFGRARKSEVVNGMAYEVTYDGETEDESSD